MTRYFLVICHIWLTCNIAVAQQRLTLYPNGSPNAIPVDNQEREEPHLEVDSLTYAVSEPSITVFHPTEKVANGTLIIICPGGGYHVLLTKREGSDIAKMLNELGVTAIVLRYRIPDDRTMPEKHLGPIQDLQQTIAIARNRAEEWGIDTNRIGVMGFSAGGHLAATAGTHHTTRHIISNDQTNLRPDFMLLINPVISFSQTFGHLGSRNNLLGNNPDEEQIRYFSNEHHVDETTPPTFLVHADKDEVVPVENSLAFYRALHENGVPVGLHIYPKGEHGFISAPAFDEWFGRCVHWLKAMEFIN